MKVSAEQAMGMAWAITQHGQDVMIQQQGHWLTLDFFTVGVVLCVWDRTGSVYETESIGGGENNAVADDPIFTPGEYSKVTLPNTRLVKLLNEVADERDEYKARLDAVRDAQDESARQRALTASRARTRR